MPGDLERETYNGLSVRDLVAHVAIVDEAFVRVGGTVRRRTWPFIGADAVAAMTEAELPATADCRSRRCATATYAPGGS